ncbi:MAG: SDR family oxidoreductase [Bacteroidaceae bacterium]|nr:SDR family oxidoreductase [Bacteroidaceae bacterium]
MAYNPYSLEGKTILVTGAGSGIGRATAVECSRMGARLVLVDINEAALNDTLAMLEVQDREHLCCVVNLCDESAIEAMVKGLPQIDGCSHNAGITNLVPIQFITAEEMERIHRVNLLAPILLTKYLVKKKKLNRPSSIVFTASAGGVFCASVGNAIYATSKCGIDAYMRTAALELAPKGIRCNSVNPGMVETPLINRGQVSPEQHEKDKENYPLGRYGQPEDVAHATIFLLSDASSWMTGTALKIDGGLTLR